jgi:exopolysaccharide production protein ExoZ
MIDPCRRDAWILCGLPRYGNAGRESAPPATTDDVERPESMTPAPIPRFHRVSPAPLLSLQILRAAAALLVLVHHAGYDADTIASRTGLRLLDLDRIFDWAFGIHLFFVVSGYIMVRTTSGFGSARGAMAFMARRIVRVVPLYWLMTSLLLVGAMLAPGLLNTPLGGPVFVFASYLFFPLTGTGAEWHPVLGQGWTLDYEMFFYVLFAIAMLLPRRSGLAALAGTLAGLVLFGTVWHPAIAPLGVWTDGLLLEFLFGIAIGLAQEAGLRSAWWTSALALVAGAMAAVSLGPLFPVGDGLAPWIRGGLPAAIMVGACVLGPPWRRRPLALALATIGDASYSLYLSHPFVVRGLRDVWLASVPGSAPLSAYVALASLGAVLSAVLLYRCVERPMTLRLQHMTRLADIAGRPILPDAAAVSPKHGD